MRKKNHNNKQHALTTKWILKKYNQIEREPNIDLNAISDTKTEKPIFSCFAFGFVRFFFQCSAIDMNRIR